MSNNKMNENNHNILRENVKRPIRHLDKSFVKAKEPRSSYVVLETLVN